jgi:hypothetical protein
MSAPVSFISPLTITPSMIASSTAVSHAATEADWVAGTSYGKGTVVYRPTYGRRYENLVPGINAGLPEDTPDRWYDLEATDAMTMFDAEVSTQSIADGALITVFAPGAFNSMYLAGLDGTSLTVTVKAEPGGSVIYADTQSLEDSEPDDYYEWCFAPFKPKTDYIALNLDPYAGCEVTLAISSPGSIPKCGMASLGDLVSLGGQALQGAKVIPRSFARVVADSRGKTSIKKGKAARDMAVTAMISIDDVDAVADALTSVLGVPCAWIGTDSARLRSMRTFGLGNGDITVGGNSANLNLTVNGMI